MVSAMTIANDDERWFERQDCSDRSRRTMLNDHTHLGCERRIGRLCVARCIKVEFGKNAVAHPARLVERSRHLVALLADERNDRLVHQRGVFEVQKVAEIVEDHGV